MRSSREDDMIIIRMMPEEEIVSSLVEVCREYKVRTAVILSSIGQLKDFKLGYFVQKGDYSPEVFVEPHELLSLSGIITQQDGEFIPHIHAVLGNRDKRTFGGHLIEGTVEITNETVLLTRDIELRRVQNPETGLQDLVP